MAAEQPDRSRLTREKGKILGKSVFRPKTLSSDVCKFIYFLPVRK